MTRQDSLSDETDVPLVVDVDSALLRSDPRLETLWAAMGRHVVATLWGVLASVRAPERMMERLRAVARPDPNLLPLRDRVVDLIHRAQQSSRPVILTSQTDAQLAQDLRARLGLPNTPPETGPRTDGAAMAVTRFGAGGFDYVGGAPRDPQVWRQAREVIAIAPNGRLPRPVLSLGQPVEIIASGWRLRDLLTGMRPYQWIKNLLLFLPALTAHMVTGATLGPVAMAFAAFCLGTSAVYLVNDLFDLAADRQHPEKTRRPIAAGDLPIDVAMVASLTLAMASLVIGCTVNWAVVAMLLLYMATALAYSIALKRLRWVDLMALASLYTLRVATGAAASGTGVSGWVIAFCIAVFLTLGAVKRLTALARAPTGAALPGRGYTRRDQTGLMGFALTGTLVASAIFLAYTTTPAASGLYSDLWVLRLAVLPILLWLTRMIRLGNLGQEDYDPVAFFLRDRVGLAIFATGLALALISV